MGTVAFNWCKEQYEKSISSRCWSWTPYGDGWDNCLKWGGDLQNDVEMREIAAMEAALGEIPEWAVNIVISPIQCVAPCGHIAFPRSYVDAIEAIGSGECPRLHHTCYTLDRQHKLLIQDLSLMLDGWLAGAAPEEIAVELNGRDTNGWDWNSICNGLWNALGEHSELKDLLTERLLHQLRWWVKQTVWDDDLDGNRWGRDQYLGKYNPKDDFVTGNGNKQLGSLPGVNQVLSPRVKKWDKRLEEICPNWDFFRTVITEFSWPCGPKAFRYYEKLICCIGKEKQVISMPSFKMNNPEDVPNYLGPLASPPDIAMTSAWWNKFMSALDAWWQNEPLPDNEIARMVGDKLGEVSPIKQWLVRLYAHRLNMLVVHSGILDKLVIGKR